MSCVVVGKQCNTKPTSSICLPFPCHEQLWFYKICDNFAWETERECVRACGTHRRQLQNQLPERIFEFSILPNFNWFQDITHTNFEPNRYKEYGTQPGTSIWPLKYLTRQKNCLCLICFSPILTQVHINPST